MHIEVPPDGISDAYGRVVGAFKDAARVRGFRKGKAPADVVERTYAKEISEEAKEQLVPRLYRQAIEKEDVKPAAIVEVRDVNLDKERGLDFKVAIDVEPDFKLPKYRKISLKRKTVEVTDKEVEDAIDGVRERAATYQDAADREVRQGDLVSLDYKGAIDGDPVGGLDPDCSGLGDGKDFWAVMDEPEFLPGMCKAVPGMAIGDEKDVTVEFPADYRVEAVQGKQAVYHVTVNAVREKVLPEIDEEFLKKLEVSSVGELRQKIRKNLVSAAEVREEQRLRDEIAKSLLDSVKCDLPETVVDRETGVAARSMVQRFALQGASREQIEERTDEIVGAARRSSGDRVKLSYILSKIAEQESVEVSDGEVDERIRDTAAARGVPEGRLKADLSKRGSLEGLRADIRSEKTLDHLLTVVRIRQA